MTIQKALQSAQAQAKFDARLADILHGGNQIVSRHSVPLLRRGGRLFVRRPVALRSRLTALGFVDCAEFSGDALAEAAPLRLANQRFVVLPLIW